MINSFVLQGRLTKDVEFGTTTSGVAYANFTIAWNEKFNESEQTLFMYCKAWRNTAELLHKHFKKGQELVAEGKLITETYEKDGVNKSSTRFVVDRVHFTGKKEENATTSTTSAAEQTTLEPIDDNDLPF